MQSTRGPSNNVAGMELLESRLFMSAGHVLPSGAHFGGKSQAQWSAAWWQYITSVPAKDNPMFDETGADAHVGQSGKVFFLVGKFTFDPTNTAHRSITLPTGQHLFFPMLNNEDDNLFYDPPLSEAELRAGLAGRLEGATLYASIDGKPVGNLFSHRLIAPVFDYTIPDDNVYDGLGIPEPAMTITGAVADGYYLMLSPLSPGEHEIRFGGTLPGQTLDVTYDITVVPRGQYLKGNVSAGAEGAHDPPRFATANRIAASIFAGDDDFLKTSAGVLR